MVLALIGLDKAEMEAPAGRLVLYAADSIILGLLEPYCSSAGVVP